MCSTVSLCTSSHTRDLPGWPQTLNTGGGLPTTGIPGEPGPYGLWRLQLCWTRGQPGWASDRGDQLWLAATAWSLWWATLHPPSSPNSRGSPVPRWPLLSPSSTECVGRSTLAHLRFCSSLNPWLSFFPCPPLWSPRSQEAFLILFQPCISVLWALLCLHYFLCSHFLREKINPLSPSPDYKLLEVGGPFLLILVAPSRSSTVFGTSCWRTFHLWKKKSNSNPVLLPACVFKIVTALKCTDGMWHCILFSIFTPIPCIPTPEPSHHFFHFICYCPGNRCFSNCRI